MDVAKFPGWRFGPEGEQQLFQSEEQVPEGWTDNPNDHKPKGSKVEPLKQPVVTPPVVSPYDGKTKAELIELIKGRTPTITFNKNWPEKKLIELLVADDKKKA